MAPHKVVLLACGSFNPPTNMHLRMFELARDHLHRFGTEVIGGVISPVHDSYGKKELAASSHRCAMVRASLESSNWVKMSEWECRQEEWARTRTVLQFHQNSLNAAIQEPGPIKTTPDTSWFPDSVITGSKDSIEVKLLCGADLLESFGTPGLWSEADIHAIVGQHGLVVLSRLGSDPQKFIYESDILTALSINITIVVEFVINDISSTKIRRALRRSESIKYLIPDQVIQYIYRNNLYGSSNSKYLQPDNRNGLNIFLTPSPSDIIMATPSPTWDHKQFGNNNSNSISTNQTYTQIDIDTVDALNKLNNAKTTRPGQAVKIITAATGEHTIVPNQVGIPTAVDKLAPNVDASNTPIETETTGSRQAANSSEQVAASDLVVVDATAKIKAAKSCHNFIAEHTLNRIKSSRSTVEICDFKNCDENLIKFIFTNHGIQVISDIETVV